MSDIIQNSPDYSNVSILVVDDEPYVRDLMCRWLKDHQYACTQVDGADEAMEQLRRREFALLLTDINMPGRSGLALLDDVHREYPDVAVLMMTAIGETKTAVHALTHGAWGYMVKPVDRDELLCQVAGAIERRHLRLEQRSYLRNLEETVRQHTAEIRQAHEETIYRLVTASLCRDEETGMHIKRTGLLSELLARAAGWTQNEAETIRLAAPMHDVGKIGIRDAILRKPGPLTHAEFEVMKTHTIIGAKMLEGSHSAILHMARDIALNHHERWDGGGYPRGIVGMEIPEAARIVSIVDVYDALSHDRVYRHAFPDDRVLRFMYQGCGSQFDPSLFAVFLSHYDELRQLSQANPDEAAETFDAYSFLASASAASTLFNLEPEAVAAL
jgi:putative two-component system response regulator